MAPLGNKRVSERGGTRVPAPAMAYSAQNRSQQLNNLSGVFPQSVASSGMRGTHTERSRFLPKLLPNDIILTAGGGSRQKVFQPLIW